MKRKTLVLTIVCGLTISAAAQNTASNGSGGSQPPNAGASNGSPAPGSADFNYQHRLMEPGVNNPNLNNPNYRSNPNGGNTNRFGSGILTNGFGSRAITNGFGYGGVTNGFGAGGMTNKFSGFTNSFGAGSITNGYGPGGITNYENAPGYRYTNGGTNYRNPYAIDPRVMGNGGLNNTN